MINFHDLSFPVPEHFAGSPGHETAQKLCFLAGTQALRGHEGTKFEWGGADHWPRWWGWAKYFSGSDANGHDYKRLLTSGQVDLMAFGITELDLKYGYHPPDYRGRTICQWIACFKEQRATNHRVVEIHQDGRIVNIRDLEEIKFEESESLQRMLPYVKDHRQLALLAVAGYL